MQLLNKLWSDESGLILSAEAVLIGTLGVMGATVGLHTAATAVNEELTDFGFAIRSLDQSYETTGYRSGYAWTAGSSFHQEDIEISLKELTLTVADEETTKVDPRKKIERLNKAKLAPAKKKPTAKPKKPAKAKSKTGEAAAEGDGNKDFPYRPAA